MQLYELRDYIESLLEVGLFRDYCPNGLQVEGKEKVQRIATAVTASQKVLEAATALGADALIVHHGYFWRGEPPNLVGIKKRRIAHLLQHGVSLLAYHLPLDAHPELGNNAQLAHHLGLERTGVFGDQNIACHGQLLQEITLAQFVTRVTGELGRAPLVIGDLDHRVKRVAWCSGAAQDYFEQAAMLGVDAYLTGEISERHVHLAQETNVAFIAAGHYATERFGVRVLGEHLAQQFGLEHHFIEQDCPV